MRTIWLLTYGASGPEITHTMLQNDCKLQPDEVYTTEERVHKYTEIHLKKQVRLSSITRAMDILYDRYHIIKGDIIGYDAIDGSEKRIKRKSKDAPREYHAVEDHVAFMKLVKDMNDGNPKFKAWKENSEKPGMLEPCKKIDISKPINTKFASKGVLISAVQTLQKALNETRQQHDELRQQLRDMDSLYDTEKKHRKELEQKLFLMEHK